MPMTTEFSKHLQCNSKKKCFFFHKPCTLWLTLYNIHDTNTLFLYTFSLYLKLYRYKINTNSQFTSSIVISYRSMILTIRRIGGMGAVQGNIFFKNQRKVKINNRKLLFCLCKSPAIGIDCYKFSPVCENVSTFLK